MIIIIKWKKLYDENYVRFKELKWVNYYDFSFFF